MVLAPCPLVPVMFSVPSPPPLNLRPIGRKCKNLLRGFFSKHANKTFVLIDDFPPKYAKFGQKITLKFPPFGCINAQFQ